MAIQKKIDEAIKKGWVFLKEMSNEKESFFKNQEGTFLIGYNWLTNRVSKGSLASDGNLRNWEFPVMANLWRGSYKIY